MSDFELDFGAKPGIEGAPIRSPISDAGAIRSEDELDRSLRPRSLDDFVGQTRVREQLGVFIDAARHRDEALDHALFAGPPGLGKCVTTDTMVFTSHGMEPIGDLGQVGGESWQPITRPISGLYGTKTADYFYDNGEGATLRVTTASGYRVEGTPNHPLLVRDDEGRLQFKRLGEMRTGDQVAVRIGAQVFGSTTKLRVEGVGLPSLDDPAHAPSELTPELARLLGLLMSGGRLSPAQHGFLFVSKDEARAREVVRIVRDYLCLSISSYGDGPLGERWGARSRRVATLLVGLGLKTNGFVAIPSCIYKAPKPLVMEFLKGVFWGTEHAPVVSHSERVVIAHLQLMLANIGIESTVTPEQDGWALRASMQSSSYEPFVADRRVSTISDPYLELGGQEHHSSKPDLALARQKAIQRSTLGGEDAQPLVVESTGMSANVGFGMTAAGVLVALGDNQEVSYRRGGITSSDIRSVTVQNTGSIEIIDSSVTVAEVMPIERGRALMREIADDHRALSVRSTRSKLLRDEMVELAWEPITSIEPSYAHTVDVSVPDGHTFIGNGIICHNTTLASVVANELGSTMHSTSGPALEKKADVAAILTSLGERDVLFIDEIHRLSTAIEEILYTAMEDYQIDIVLGQGPAARTVRLDLEPFTLVGATTRTGLLTTPLRDRFGITQRLEYYDSDDLTHVVLRSARLLELEIDSEAAVEIAMRSRGTPRIANRLLRRVRDVAQVRHDGVLTLEIAREALDLVDIDAEGLDRIDRMVLEFILTKFGGGPVGLSTLAVAIGEEPHTIEDVYEPFLLQRGYIQRTPRGRIITPRGRAHLADQGVVSSVQSTGLF